MSDEDSLCKPFLKVEDESILHHPPCRAVEIRCPLQSRTCNKWVLRMAPLSSPGSQSALLLTHAQLARHS